MTPKRKFIELVTFSLLLAGHTRQAAEASYHLEGIANAYFGAEGFDPVANVMAYLDWKLRAGRKPEFLVHAEG